MLLPLLGMFAQGEVQIGPGGGEQRFRVDGVGFVPVPLPYPQMPFRLRHWRWGGCRFVSVRGGHSHGRRGPPLPLSLLNHHSTTLPSFLKINIVL